MNTPKHYTGATRLYLRRNGEMSLIPGTDDVLLIAWRPNGGGGVPDYLRAALALAVAQWEHQELPASRRTLPEGELIRERLEAATLDRDTALARYGSWVDRVRKNNEANDSERRTEHEAGNRTDRIKAALGTFTANKGGRRE